jgi:hypothetical protein
MDTPFDFNAPAEVFTAKRVGMRAQPVTYARFPTGAEAVRYAIERLEANKQARTIIESGDERYDNSAIRKLYDSAAYPLSRAE